MKYISKMSKNTILIGAFLGFVSVCGSPETAPQPQSSVEALSSSDWFREGTDRFYLAYAELDLKVDDDFPKVQAGHQYLFGIGCNGEDENPNALVFVHKSTRGEELIQIPLSQREKLHHFRDPLRSGECKILLGGEEPGIGILNNEFNSLSASANRSLWEINKAAVVCTSFVAAVLGVSLVHGRRLSLDVQKVAKEIVYGVKSAARTGLEERQALVKSAGLVAGITTLLSTGTWCGDSVVSRVQAAKDFYMQNNRSVIFQAFTEAERFADQSISANQKDLFSYLQALSEEKFEVARGIYNPFFVRAFNRQVEGNFEQGWGFVKNNNKFFDSVKSLQTRLVDESGKSFHGDGELPASYVTCDVEQIRACMVDGRMNHSCFKNNCVNMKKILEDIEVYR